MKTVRIMLLVCCLATGSGVLPLHAETVDAQWELKRDRDSVQVYTRDVAGSKFKAVRSTMTVTAPLTAAVALVRDLEACPDWAALCKEARLVRGVSETEMYVYTYNDVPWPVSDRDAVTHVVWSRDEATGTVTMTATAAPEALPEQRGAVRLHDVWTTWAFTPLSDGRLRVVSEAHIDPAGPVPAWITNLLLVDSPFDTMRNMREILATGRYSDASFEFIANPGKPGSE